MFEYAISIVLSHIQSTEPEPTAEDDIKKQLASKGVGKVVCRLCKGDHFTAKCPYKESLAGLDSGGMYPVPTPTSHHVR